MSSSSTDYRTQHKLITQLISDKLDASFQNIHSITVFDDKKIPNVDHGDVGLEPDPSNGQLCETVTYSPEIFTVYY